MSQLDNDAFFEILSWLPAKAIYKLTSSSKSVSSFSKETYFATKQSQKAFLKDDSCFFIQPETSQIYNNSCIELHALPGEESLSGVSKDVLKFLSSSSKIVSSSNGLILCRATVWDKVELFICNPATRFWVPIPIPEQVKKFTDQDLKIVFECDENNDCTLFLFHDDDKAVEDSWPSGYLDCKVYSAKEGVWKEKEASFFTGDRDLRFDMPVFLNGEIHFISDCSSYLLKGSPYFRPYIMSYSFEKGGVSRMLRVPREARRGSHDQSCKMGVFKWGRKVEKNESICLVRLRKCVFTVWVLTDYESCLWKKVLKVRVKAMLGLMEKEKKLVVKGFSVLNGELLVFATEKKVYGYKLGNENVKIRAEEICEHGCDAKYCSFTSYSNTLRTCIGGDADARPLVLNPISVKEQPPLVHNTRSSSYLFSSKYY